METQTSHTFHIASSDKLLTCKHDDGTVSLFSCGQNPGFCLVLPPEQRNVVAELLEQLTQSYNQDAECPEAK